MQNGHTRQQMTHDDFGVREEEEQLEKNDANSTDDSSNIDENEKSPVVKACKRKKLLRQQSAGSSQTTGLPSWRSCFHTFHGEWSRKRKLIIHLDIRNTILVADSVTNVAVEEALNSFLTGVVWGLEVGGEWQWHSASPSLKAPTQGLCTYYKYLEKKLVKNSTDRINLRLQTGDFAYTSLGKRFQRSFNTHLKQLAWDYDVECDKVLTMSGRDGKPYHYILPSVYKLLHYLTEQGRDFAIIIRTYGRDAPNVLSSLNYGIRGNHPAFRKHLRIKVNKNPGIIKRGDNTFGLKTFKRHAGHEIEHMLTHERDIYRLLCTSQGITGFVDDFLFWQKNNYDHAAGKPMWIDPHDNRYHHIFFDDNFRADDEDSIIDVRMFNKENPTLAESLAHFHVARLENVCLVQADLLESIADDNYFIRMTNICQENYAHMIKSGDVIFLYPSP